MITESLESSPILPVVVLEDAQKALPLAEALLEGGITGIEVTFRTKAAAAAIASIRSSLPEMVVSAGTVVTKEQAQAAIDSGAQFGLAPGLDPEIVEIFHSVGLPFVPGIMTPTDVQGALKIGCRHLKFFPAEAAGGLPLLRSLAAPFRSFEVRFCPTGGLNPGNVGSYLAVDEVFAIGGTWIATAGLINQNAWREITDLAREAVQLIS